VAATRRPVPPPPPPTPVAANESQLNTAAEADSVINERLTTNSSIPRIRTAQQKQGLAKAGSGGSWPPPLKFGIFCVVS